MGTDSQLDRTVREGIEPVRLRGLQGLPPEISTSSQWPPCGQEDFALEWQVVERRPPGV